MPNNKEDYSKGNKRPKQKNQDVAPPAGNAGEKEKRLQFGLADVSMRKYRVLENVVSNAPSYFSEVMPIVGMYNAPTVSRMLQNGRQNILLGSNANKVNRDSSAYVSYVADIFGLTLEANMMSIPMQPVETSNISNAAKQYASIANEMWAKIGSYAMSNANLFQWSYTSGSKVITGEVMTDAILVHQYVIRAIASVVRNYDILRAYEARMMDQEYLNDDSKMSIVFAELKRSRWYSQIDILRQRVAKQYFDFQTWELEDAAVIFPSKRTNGFDSVIKQITILYNDLADLEFTRANGDTLTVTSMIDNINEVLSSLNMPNIFKLVRTKDVSAIKTALNGVLANIDQMVQDINAFVISCTDITTQYTLLAGNGLLNDRWQKGYYIERFADDLPFFFNLTADAIIKVAGVGQSTIQAVNPVAGKADNNSYGYQLFTLMSSTEGIPSIYSDQIRSLYAFIGKKIQSSGLISYNYAPYAIPSSGYTAILINRKGAVYNISVTSVNAPGKQTTNRELAPLSILEGAAVYLVPSVSVTDATNVEIAQVMQAVKDIYYYAVMNATGSGSNAKIAYCQDSAITEIAILMEPVYAWFEWYYEYTTPFQFINTAK